MKSFIYSGTLHHKRTKPKTHDFSYQVALFYLDLDEVDQIFNVPFFLSSKGPRLAGFDRKDYLKGQGSLKKAVADLIHVKTGQNFSGSVRMLSQIRYLGICFNPVTFYYCFDAEEKLKFIISDITNTPWNERHAYVHEVKTELNENQFEFKKDFHVSPFLPMDLHYSWKFKTPHPEQALDRLIVHMEDWDLKLNEKVFEAHLVVQAKPLTRAQVVKTILEFPFLTLKTIFAIYYQALLLKLKGAHFYSHPNPGNKI